jgi:hypothetical protein
MQKMSISIWTAELLENGSPTQMLVRQDRLQGSFKTVIRDGPGGSTRNQYSPPAPTPGWSNDGEILGEGKLNKPV